MRKYLALALVIVFLTPIHSVAAVKAGDKCAKLKATSTSAGKKYTCIKSGSRLIWDKGQVIKAPATPAKPAAATPESATANDNSTEPTLPVAASPVSSGASTGVTVPALPAATTPLNE
jgi:hypothetical protein